MIIHNEGIASIANIIQYSSQYLVRYFSTISSVLQYFSWVLQYLIHQHANFALHVLTQYSKFGNVYRNIQDKLGKRALKSDLKSTVRGYILLDYKYSMSVFVNNCQNRKFSIFTTTADTLHHDQPLRVIFSKNLIKSRDNPLQ